MASAAVATNLNDEIQEFSASLVGKFPAAAIDIFKKETELFVEKYGASKFLPIGSTLPDAQLLDAHGKSLSLKQALNGKPAVLAFYRGEWCPYCNITLRHYEKNLLPELKKLGVSLIAVSPQKPDAALSIEQKHNLTFAVVSDPGNQLATALGSVVEHSDVVKQTQQKIGVDVASSNVDGTHKLPMSGVALVDGAGVLRWLDLKADYTVRPEPKAILDAVAKL